MKYLWRKNIAINSRGLGHINKNKSDGGDSCRVHIYIALEGKICGFVVLRVCESEMTAVSITCILLPFRV